MSEQKQEVRRQKQEARSKIIGKTPSPSRGGSELAPEVVIGGWGWGLGIT